MVFLFPQNSQPVVINGCFYYVHLDSATSDGRMTVLYLTKSYHTNVPNQFRKEYNCVMKYLVQEYGFFGPFYIGLKADAGDSQKNLFEWERPMGKM